ncbi:hypothetical protein TNIN_125651 [Trichonephila inaurata madagascariensis]|uniref:Uncharacterized protein n=1 Tax=Trichonephila inaurata madagascariensis TaxID=2747483 RepID=A0A8X6IH38_9ARAC|nr:hypothetical protein TNIN_125651 [Trichonephila inaurata madagascariensis]
MVEKLNVSVEEYNVLNVKQTKGILKLNQTCTLDLKVGSLVRSVRFFILNTDLPYALLGLRSCIAFQLIIDCVKQVVVQEGRNLINFSSSEGSDLSLHINPENKVKKKEKVNKGEIDVVKNRTKENNVLKFSNISETDSDNGGTRCQIEVEDNSETKDFGENFELKEIFECYEDVNDPQPPNDNSKNSERQSPPQATSTAVTDNSNSSSDVQDILALFKIISNIFKQYPKLKQILPTLKKTNDVKEQALMLMEALLD